MQLFVLVLNRTECLEPILEQMLIKGISGATILESTGMMRVLDPEDEDQPIFGMIRHLVDPQRKGSKTMLALLEEEQLPIMRRIIREETGGLDKPDTGIAFSIPTLFVEGLTK